MYDLLFNSLVGMSLNIHSLILLLFGGKKSDSVSIDVVLVDCKLLRSWSKCPFSVAIVVGNSFLKLMVSIAGQEIKLPFWMAFVNVDIQGEKQHACQYLARSVFDLSAWIM